MKTYTNISKRTVSAAIAVLLAIVFAVSSVHALRNGSSQMAAAAVAESPNRVQTDSTRNSAVNATALAKKDSIASAKKNAESARTIGSGEASYYGRGFAGRPTANGERFDPAAMTAAHRTLPFGSMVRVTNTNNGRSIVVRVNDRGPYAHGRIIDLSRGAAEKIGMVQSGTANVKLELIS